MPAGRGLPEGIDRVPFTGSPGQVAEDIDAYAASGLTHILFSPPVADVEELVGEMRVIAAFGQLAEPVRDARGPAPILTSPARTGRAVEGG